jgi:hypothetical protein
MFAMKLKNAGRPKVCLAAMLVAAASAAGGPASAGVIAQWNAIAADTITPPPGVVYPAVTPEEQRPNFSIDLATVHVAIYDAVNAITCGYEVFAIAPQSPTAGASPEAAAGAAACGVLQGLFPNRAAQYATPCLPYQASSQGDDATKRGIAVGIEVANGVLALRANDGRSLNIVYVPGSEPGDFRGVNPVNTAGPYMRPFTLTSTAQFRADGPPALGSATYAEDFNEVKRAHLRRDALPDVDCARQGARHESRQVGCQKLLPSGCQPLIGDLWRWAARPGCALASPLRGRLNRPRVEARWRTAPTS